VSPFTDLDHYLKPKTAQSPSSTTCVHSSPASLASLASPLPNLLRLLCLLLRTQIVPRSRPKTRSSCLQTVKTVKGVSPASALHWFHCPTITRSRQSIYMLVSIYVLQRGLAIADMPQDHTMSNFLRSTVPVQFVSLDTPPGTLDSRTRTTL
jgi:hypothetical protein